MTDKEVLVTAEGLKKLEAELGNLKSVKRKEIAERIKSALEFGDVNENSEFDEAKNEQAQVESRIMQLEQIIKNAKVIEIEDVNTKVVSVGAKVKVLDMGFNEEIEYTIVGSTEVEPENHKISNESPVGKALLGQKKGATVTVEVPDGKITLKVLKIHK